jgi:hypothetical protein
MNFKFIRSLLMKLAVGWTTEGPGTRARLIHEGRPVELQGPGPTDGQVLGTAATSGPHGSQWEGKNACSRIHGAMAK